MAKVIMNVSVKGADKGQHYPRFFEQGKEYDITGHLLETWLNEEVELEPGNPNKKMVKYARLKTLMEKVTPLIEKVIPTSENKVIVEMENKAPAKRTRKKSRK